MEPLTLTIDSWTNITYHVQSDCTEVHKCDIMLRVAAVPKTLSHTYVAANPGLPLR